MNWSWKRKQATQEAEIKAVARTIHQELTGRPDYKVAALIVAGLQETLRNLFGKSGEDVNLEAVARVVCEYLYCTSCLTFSALCAADNATAKEGTILVTKWTVETVGILLLDPGYVSGEANAIFRQTWDAMTNDRLKAEQSSEYLTPTDAVDLFVQNTLPVLITIFTPDALVEVYPRLYADMEFLLEKLVFSFPELFCPAVSTTGGTISASSGYGLGLVQHYSRLDARRAERIAFCKAEQAAYSELSSKIEKFIHSRRDPVS